MIAPSKRLRVFLTAASVAAVCACSSPEKFVPTSVTPQELLGRYLKAVRPPAGAGIYHSRFRTITNDGDVTVSDFYEAGGERRSPDYRVTTLVDGMRLGRGRISGRSWQQDADGLVVPDSEMRNVFDRVIEAAVRKADPRVRMLGVTTDLPRRYVLEIVPNSRLLQRRYFDAKTFLPSETVTKDYDGQVQVDRLLWLRSHRRKPPDIARIA
jgi:hypothetical protein